MKHRISFKNTKVPVKKTNALVLNASVDATDSATKINKSSIKLGDKSLTPPGEKFSFAWSHLESLASLGMVTVLMLDTCGGGTWHMLHGQGMPVPTPQCWKLLPRGPALAVGALRSPWWGLTEVTAEIPGAEREAVETAAEGRRG